MTTRFRRIGLKHVSRVGIGGILTHQAHTIKCCGDLADAVEVHTGMQCKVGHGKRDGLRHKTLGLGEWGVKSH